MRVHRRQLLCRCHTCFLLGRSRAKPEQSCCSFRAIRTSRRFKEILYKPIGSSNPSLSASKSLILQEKMSLAQLCRRFRGLAPAATRVGHRESEFLALCTFSVGPFSEGNFA